MDYFFQSDVLSYLEFCEQKNQTVHDPTPKTDTKVSDQIFGSNAEEVTSSVKQLSDKIQHQ